MFGLFKKKSAQTTGPDFSAVDSREKAFALFEQGQLEKVHLLPLEFGGEDIELNTLLVPLGVANAKDGIDKGVIGPLAREGKITKYNASPEYQGSSFIPIAIKIVASEPARFETTIAIWGDALSHK